MGADRRRLRLPRSMAPPTARCFSRTPTTRSARPTSSCAPWSTTANGTPASSRPSEAAEEVSRARPDEDDCRGGAWACGDPGMQFDTTINALAYLPQHRPHQRVESMQRVHASGQLGLQSRVAQPAEVPRRARRVRRAAPSATPSM